MGKGLTGGQVIAKMLAAEGVEDMFGIIDGTYFGLYRALADNGIELHSPRHEAAAMHMAGAYARLTGRLGVAMASNGPGVANVLPGVAVEQGEGSSEVVAGFLAHHADARSGSIDVPWGRVAGAGRQLLPGDPDDCDGFFFAQIRKAMI